jgi:hypothetical protein
MVVLRHNEFTSKYRNIFYKVLKDGWMYRSFHLG